VRDDGPDGHGTHPPPKESQKAVDQFFTDWPERQDNPDTPTPDDTGKHEK
jgi:hypothetical protein